MPTERTQRQIDTLLDEAEAAIKALQWSIVRDRAHAALALDRDNPDARHYLTAASEPSPSGRGQGEGEATTTSIEAEGQPPPDPNALYRRAFVGRDAELRQLHAACEKGRHRPELALCRLQLAELLLDHYPGERAEAIDHLGFAIRECRDMKMAPSLERAWRRRGLLQA